MGRTSIQGKQQRNVQHFNSLAPCGANLSGAVRLSICFSFQLTRPVWGEPAAVMVGNRNVAISTHSPRVGRTREFWTIEIVRGISTHSPRVGRTGRQLRRRERPQDFNSLAPCGANQCKIFYLMKCFQFQLTRPVWGEPIEPSPSFTCFGFQLTRPVWGEPSLHRHLGSKDPISTHSPRVGRTPLEPISEEMLSNFNSLAPCGANPVIGFVSGNS